MEVEENTKVTRIPTKGVLTVSHQTRKVNLLYDGEQPGLWCACALVWSDQRCHWYPGHSTMPVWVAKTSNEPGTIQTNNQSVTTTRGLHYTRSGLQIHLCWCTQMQIFPRWPQNPIMGVNWISYNFLTNNGFPILFKLGMTLIFSLLQDRQLENEQDAWHVWVRKLLWTECIWANTKKMHSFPWSQEVFMASSIIQKRYKYSAYRILWQAYDV